MSKRVAIYARVSTTRQAENDISIPDQIGQARKYCESRGWYVVREYVDRGASARDGTARNRPSAIAPWQWSKEGSERKNGWRLKRTKPRPSASSSSCFSLATAEAALWG